MKPSVATPIARVRLAALGDLLLTRPFWGFFAAEAVDHRNACRAVHRVSGFGAGTRTRKRSPPPPGAARTPPGWRTGPRRRRLPRQGGLGFLPLGPGRGR